MHKKLELGFRSSSSVLGLGWMFFLQPFYTIFISWGHSPDRDWLSDGTVALEGPWHTEEGWGFTFVMALVTVICLQKLIQGIYFLTKRQQKKHFQHSSYSSLLYEYQQPSALCYPVEGRYPLLSYPVVKAGQQGIEPAQ